MAVRKSLTGPNQPRNLVPMSKLSETIVPRFKGRWMVENGARHAPTVPTGSIRRRKQPRFSTRLGQWFHADTDAGD